MYGVFVRVPNRTSRRHLQSAGEKAAAWANPGESHRRLVFSVKTARQALLSVEDEHNTTTTTTTIETRLHKMRVERSYNS